MLTNLYVKNMALIDEADIDFENGLTVLTGETGAGKSIILDSLAIALGLKNPGEMLRENAEPALAQVSFYFSDSDLSEKIRDILEEDLPDGDLIIQRKILSGRSQFKINGINVNAAQVREIGPLLLDLHAQRDNLRLLKEENQLELVDCFCSDELSKNKEILSGKYSDYIRIKKELASLGSDDREREREADLLSFEVNELESAALKPGEDEELEERFLKIQNLQKIKEGLSSALEHISYGNGNASDSIGEARRVLGNVESFDPELARINEVLGDAEGIINDCIRDMSSYADSSDSSDEEYYEISERLNIYNRLKSKFNTDTAGLLNVLDEKKKRLEIISDFDNAKVELEGQIKALEKEMTEICKKVTAEREKTAERLGKEIAEAAKDLNFNDVRFKISIEPAGEFGENGADKARFLISVNPGEELKALNKVASGGELSRIMLAVKTVTAQEDGVETLIFDEIDTGISGRTAQKTAEKMALLSDDRQIICITHLPQIAAMGDYHFLIEKSVENNRSITDIKRLEDEESVDELSRLLGGGEITDNVRGNAREMKNMANEYKKENRS